LKVALKVVFLNILFKSTYGIIFFSFCATKTILGSIRPVCKYFYSMVNSYDKFELTLDYKTQYYFQSMCCLIPPENIVSIKLVRAEYYSDHMYFFRSVRGFRQFTRLRSLKIDCNDYKNLTEFIPIINTPSPSPSRFLLYCIGTNRSRFLFQSNDNCSCAIYC